MKRIAAIILLFNCTSCETLYYGVRARKFRDANEKEIANAVIFCKNNLDSLSVVYREKYNSIPCEAITYNFFFDDTDKDCAEKVKAIGDTWKFHLKYKQSLKDSINYQEFQKLNSTITNLVNKENSKYLILVKKMYYELFIKKTEQDHHGALYRTVIVFNPLLNPHTRDSLVVKYNAVKIEGEYYKSKDFRLW